MVRLGIWERDEELSTPILGALQKMKVNPPALLTGAHPSVFAGVERGLDLLVVSPEAVGWGGAGNIHAKMVLISGGAGPLARALQAESAVSYGTSGRDTLTLSSLEGDQICVALQRELVTVAGEVVEEQELVLPFTPGGPPLHTLAAVGTLLLLGVAPERLTK